MKPDQEPTRLKVSGLKKTFGSKKGVLSLRGGQEIRALRGVDFTVKSGETLGIVGESGCGKSTLARILLRLVAPDEGEILLGETDFRGLRGERLRHQRRRMQMVFQDPFRSLNPRLTVGTTLSEPLVAHSIVPRAQIGSEVARILDQVGLSADFARRYPRQLSGGQRQRVAIARAIAPRPEILIADEPVSSLDVSVQAQIVNLFAELQEGLRLGIVFISHDLAVVESIADRIKVMFRGRFVESGEAKNVMMRPRHPYTKALLVASQGHSAEEIVDCDRVEGPGCAYASRCPRVRERCRSELPLLDEMGMPGHRVACFTPLDERDWPESSSDHHG